VQDFATFRNHQQYYKYPKSKNDIIWLFNNQRYPIIILMNHRYPIIIFNGFLCFSFKISIRKIHPIGFLGVIGSQPPGANRHRSHSHPGANDSHAVWDPSAARMNWMN